MNWCGRPLLHTPVRYGLCLSQSDFDKALKKLGLPPEPYMGKGDEAIAHWLTAGDKVRVIVCMRRTNRPIEAVHATLVHESVHVWQRIKEYIGEENSGDEAEAYCIERIAFNLFKSYAKQRGAER